MSRLLVVYMKSRYEIYRNYLKQDANNPELRQFLDETPDGERLLRIDAAHSRNLERIMHELDRSGVKYDAHYRADLSADLIKEHDQVLTIGGDGTLLEAAGYIRDDTPIIGMNSGVYWDEELGKPVGSEGYYSTLDPFNFDKKFQLFLAREIKPIKLNRLIFEYEAEKIEHLIVNDVSIGPEDPHRTVRYVIRTQGFEEAQFSSGLIIATPQESWAMSYPGASVLSIDEKVFQAVTRANYNSRYDLDKGVQKTDGLVIRNPHCIEVESKSRTATVAIDGNHKQFPFSFGTKIKVYVSDYPISIIGFDNERRLKYYTVKKEPVIREIN